MVCLTVWMRTENTTASMEPSSLAIEISNGEQGDAQRPFGRIRHCLAYLCEPHEATQYRR